MLKTRLLSALIGISAIFLIIYAGGIFWQGFVLLLGLIAYYEYLQMMGKNQYKPLMIPGYLLLLFMLFSYYAEQWLYPGIFILIIIFVINSVLKYPQITVIDIGLSFFGAFFIGFLFSFAMRMTEFQNESLVILLALLLTWASDTGGYFGGRFFGKHKLAPLLSPNKTWEGAIGSIVLTTITAILFFLLTEMETDFWAYVILLGILASISAQFGDLFISGMKRFFAVKDTGRIIPGHGGILDRFDSFLLVAPLVFCYCLLFI
jgi:phosphatidate cytidylyltransferase